MMKAAKEYLGCQMWLEPTDSAERIDMLFRRAAEAGLGWIRLFLMWPWIEEKPGVYDFGIWDQAFDSAARHGIRIKATLTANSGPWHIGTPSMLHSHTGFLDPAQREPMRRYIRACVERYARHSALGQWILWNEPTGGAERTEETLAHWRAWLREHYAGDIERLNRRWRTGYADFAAVPFPEEVPHPVHRQQQVWNSYGPWLAHWQSRAAWLNAELAWIKALVREIDPVTDCCANPTTVLANQAAGGTDLDGMGALVECMGASYHPAWHFTFADRFDFPALMVAGVRLEASHKTVARVEVTEVQAGNTLNSSRRPCGVTPGELARFYLAGLVAGAESVTGWCLNARSYDFEAGDWGLLDNEDQPSARSQALAHLNARLADILARTGGWQPAPPRAWVGIDPRAQALEWIEARQGAAVPGRLAEDGAHGAALVAVRLMSLGIATTLANVGDLPAVPAQPGDLIVLSHLVALEAATADRLLAFVEHGGTLLLDGTTGRKDTAAALHRPWPGGLAERIGLRATGLETRPEGYDLTLHGLPAGCALLTRMGADLAPAAGWQAWPELRFARDGEPCVWERRYGQGRIAVFRGMLGPSLVHAPASVPALRYLLQRLGGELAGVVRPAGDFQGTVVVPVRAKHGVLYAVLAPDLLDRGGRAVYLSAAPGRYHDLWTDRAIRATADGQLVLALPEGIALLWPVAGESVDPSPPATVRH